jgi:hypothetical protein
MAKCYHIQKVMPFAKICKKSNLMFRHLQVESTVSKNSTVFFNLFLLRFILNNDDIWRLSSKFENEGIRETRDTGAQPYKTFRRLFRCLTLND